MAMSLNATGQLEIELLASLHQQYKDDLRYVRVPDCEWASSHKSELSEAGFRHDSSSRPRHFKLDVTLRNSYRGINFLQKAEHGGKRMVFVGLQAHLKFRASFMARVQAARDSGDVIARVAADGALGALRSLSAFANNYVHSPGAAEAAPDAETATGAEVPVPLTSAEETAAPAAAKSGGNKRERGARSKKSRRRKSKKRKELKAAQAEADADWKEELRVRRSQDGARDAELRQVADRAAGLAIAAARREAQKRTNDRRHYGEMQKRKERMAGNRLGKVVKRQATKQVKARLEAEAKRGGKRQRGGGKARRRDEASSCRRRNPAAAAAGHEQRRENGGGGRGGRGGRSGRVGQSGRL